MFPNKTGCMENFEEDAYMVKIHFRDGTSTMFPVFVDESIPDAIVELSETKGWPLRDVIGFNIETGG